MTKLHIDSRFRTLGRSIAYAMYCGLFLMMVHSLYCIFTQTSPEFITSSIIGSAASGGKSMYGKLPIIQLKSGHDDIANNGGGSQGRFEFPCSRAAFSHRDVDRIDPSLPWGTIECPDDLTMIWNLSNASPKPGVNQAYLALHATFFEGSAQRAKFRVQVCSADEWPWGVAYQSTVTLPNPDLQHLYSAGYNLQKAIVPQNKTFWGFPGELPPARTQFSLQSGGNSNEPWHQEWVHMNVAIEISVTDFQIVETVAVSVRQQVLRLLASLGGMLATLISAYAFTFVKRRPASAAELDSAELTLIGFAEKDPRDASEPLLA